MYSAILAVVAAHVVLVSYVVVAFNEDTEWDHEKKEKEAKKKS